MSLLDQAKALARSILNDATGFGVPITLTNPDGASANLYGLSTDIGLSIDPETGLTVSGRKASVSISVADITAAGFALPEAVPDEGEKPWLVQVANTAGAQVMKVTDVVPDQTLGLLTLHLGRYRT
jgi:hypothetical protein